MTVYRRNPLLMTVMGANPGGPTFIVIESMSGRVMYTKRATGVGSQAISSCVAVASRLARKNGRSYIIFLDLSRARVGATMNVGWVRGMGITEEIHADGSVTRGNPAGRRRVRKNPIGEAIVAGATSALLSRAMQRNPHLEGSACPSCSGPLAYQGTLGNREHYRCRNCGLDSSTPITRGPRSRGWKKTCGHGEITNRCRICRGRKMPSSVRPCPHGISGGGAKCVACQRLHRPGGPVRNNPAIKLEWDKLTGRKRYSVLTFAGVPNDQAVRLAGRRWDILPPSIQTEVSKGWRDTARRERERETVRMNPGPRGKRRTTITVEQFADWVKKKNDPRMWKAFLAKFKGYEKWTHGARAQKVTLEWIDTPGVDGLWITYDGGKQPESTYIMPKGSPRKGAWKHPWDTMPDIKHDPQAGIVITKLRGQSKITDFYHK